MVFLPSVPSQKTQTRTQEMSLRSPAFSQCMSYQQGFRTRIYTVHPGWSAGVHFSSVMAADGDCLLDGIYSYHGDKPVGMSVRDYLDC